MLLHYDHETDRAETSPISRNHPVFEFNIVQFLRDICLLVSLLRPYYAYTPILTDCSNEK